MFVLLILIGLEPAIARSNARFEGSLSDLGWMAGAWTCEKWGGEMKEIWAAPSGNSMIGMFSHVKAGEPGFYEFMAIEKNKDGLRFYLRHFSPKSIAWEDKQSPMIFSVTIASKNEVVFERIDAPETNTKLIYKLESPDKLMSRLEKTKDGKTQVEVFNFTRSK